MKKILIVDDEDILRMLIKDTLEELNVYIEEANDGEMALESIINKDYDLIILDYMMPKLTGLNVLEMLPTEKKDSMKVLMLTAKSQDEDKKIAIDKGVDYFMSKPFSPMELYSVVVKILDE